MASYVVPPRTKQQRQKNASPALPESQAATCPKTSAVAAAAAVVTVISHDVPNPFTPKMKRVRKNEKSKNAPVSVVPVKLNNQAEVHESVEKKYAKNAMASVTPAESNMLADETNLQNQSCHTPPQRKYSFELIPESFMNIMTSLDCGMHHLF